MSERPDVIDKQPVSAVTWRHRSELVPNDYNPNHVAKRELELLKISILEDGWTQPIVVQEDGNIVDGFHRWMVSGHDELTARFHGWVPTVTVDLDPSHRMMSTIRHNRARGKHGIDPMSGIVRAMAADGLPPHEIMQRLQMERVEYERLVKVGGVLEKVNVDDELGRAWTTPEGADLES